MAGRRKTKKDLQDEMAVMRSRLAGLTEIEEEHGRELERISRLNLLKGRLLGTMSLGEKLKAVTDGVVEIFQTDFARIWMIREGDLCERGCRHRVPENGAGTPCRKNRCLHLIASSGRYTRVDGRYGRVPLGTYKIGRVASGDDRSFVSNDLAHDPRVHDPQWVEALNLVSFAGYGLYSPEGNPVGVLALFKDRAIPPAEAQLIEDLASFTSQVILASTAAEALRESEERHRAILETFDGLIYIVSEDYHIEYMNRTFVDRTGYDAVGEHCYEVFHGLHEVCPWCVNHRVFSGETVRWDLLSPKDNRWYYIVNTPIYHLDGTKSKQALILDITDRKRSEQEVVRLNAELRERLKDMKIFSYSISHDLKAPLMTLDGFSRRLLEKYTPSLDEKGVKYLELINRSSRQMAAFIQDLLDLFSSGTREVTRSSVRMERTARDAYDQLGLSRKEHPVRLNIKPLPDTYGDNGMIRQIYANLLGNAVKYGKAGEMTEIEVGGWREDERNVYYVKDNGIGFDSEHTDRLFEVFERLHPVAEYEGTGLGLAIVKRFVERHGGEVWAKGRVNEGATFYFSIPRVPAREETTGRPHRPGDASRDLQLPV